MWSSKSLNFLKHLLHPKRAACPRKPQTFLLAGISQAMHARDSRTQILRSIPPIVTGRMTPVKNFLSSSTRGVRYELVVSFGSLGPGINPIRTTLSGLYHLLLGRFWMV